MRSGISRVWGAKLSGQGSGGFIRAGPCAQAQGCPLAGSLLGLGRCELLLLKRHQQDASSRLSKKNHDRIEKEVTSSCLSSWKEQIKVVCLSNTAPGGSEMSSCELDSIGTSLQA